MPTDSDSYTFRITNAIDITTGNNVTVTTTPAIAGTHTATFTQLYGTTQGVKYQIAITNSIGCVAYVDATITSPEPLELQTGVISATQYVCEGNKGLSTPKVSVDTSKIRGGIPPYTIEFFDNGGNSLGNGTEYTLSNLNGGTFYAMIKRRFRYLCYEHRKRNSRTSLRVANTQYHHNNISYLRCRRGDQHQCNRYAYLYSRYTIAL